MVSERPIFSKYVSYAYFKIFNYTLGFWANIVHDVQNV